mmetsp:Transcript_81286/g.99626  ORF Transcript_81286/g.99626 Transcript_81286/m.99626 type:complete len:100 (+) Transcript_81286:316-615(+)
MSFEQSFDGFNVPLFGVKAVSDGESVGDHHVLIDASCAGGFEAFVDEGVVVVFFVSPLFAFGIFAPLSEEVEVVASLSGISVVISAPDVRDIYAGIFVR